MDECKCEKCRECCKRIPGISTPDDLVKQAKYLNLSLKEYLETYCVKGYRGSIFEEGETIYFAYPARVGWNNKSEDWGYPLTGNQCIFLTKEELCLIHPVKSLECRESFGCKSDGTKRDKALRIWQKAWKESTIPTEIKEFLINI